MKRFCLLLLLTASLCPAFSQSAYPGLSFSFTQTITDEYHDNRIRKRPESSAICEMKVDCRVLANTDTTLKVEATIKWIKLDVRDETRFRFNSEEDRNPGGLFGRSSGLVRNLRNRIDRPFEVMLNNKGEVVNHKELQNSYRFSDSMETLFGTPTLHSASVASLQMAVAGSLGEIFRFTFTESIRTESVITSGTHSYDAFSTDSVSWLERVPFVGRIRERKDVVHSRDIEERQKDTIMVTRRSPEGIELVHKKSNKGSASTQIKKDALQFNATYESEKKVTLNPKLRVTLQEAVTTETTTLSSDGITEKGIKISRETIRVDWP